MKSTDEFGKAHTAPAGAASSAPEDPVIDLELPDGVAELFDRVGEEPAGLVLLAGPSARRTGFAQGAAVGLARRLAREGRRIVLVDLVTRSPTLHRWMDATNLQGITDVLLFGASLRHVAVRTSEENLAFVPAGPLSGDPAPLLGHPSWGRLLDGASGAEATLLLFTDTNAPGVDRLVEVVGSAVLLADEDDAAERAKSGLPELPVLEPGQKDSVPGAAAGTGDTAGGDDLPPGDIVGSSSGDAAPRTGEAPPEGGSVQPPPVEPVDAPVPADAQAPAGKPVPAGAPVPAVTPASERRNRLGRFAVAVLVLAAVVALAWIVARAFAGEPLPTQPTPVSPPPSPTGLVERPVVEAPPVRPLPYSVAIEAHENPARALARAEALRELDLPSDFLVAPVVVDGVVYHRVMAGPHPDREAAENVMRALVDAGQKRTASEWDVRPTRLAFHLGDFSTREAARARAEELGGAGIPAYVVRTAPPDAPGGWRVYAGAYEDERRADHLAVRLAEAGIDAPLIERSGALP